MKSVEEALAHYSTPKLLAMLEHHSYWMWVFSEMGYEIRQIIVIHLSALQLEVERRQDEGGNSGE